MTASTSLEEIPCIFGHGYNEDVAIEENGFKGRRCKSCGLIHQPTSVPGESIDLIAMGRSEKTKELLRFAVAYCSHFVRYRIGALQSSSAVPRTLLVTARKAGENLRA